MDKSPLEKIEDLVSENEMKQPAFPKGGPVVLLNKKHFRDGTTLESREINFVLLNGGLGDYINYMAAILWAANECPHVIGKVFVDEPFKSVAEFLLKDFEKWKVISRKQFKENYTEGSLMACPIKGSQLINPTGAHLLDLGFMYYAQRFPPFPEYNFLPRIKFNPVNSFGLEEKVYAVFTPGATAQNRQTPPKAFNELVRYTISKGVTPVFLGKKEINERYTATFSEEYDFSVGIDLREKTTLLEAISIMEGARFVLGIDNGLLHMAGCTEVPIIFGHNISPVEHRKIRRKKGLTIDIAVHEKVLSCIGCQSKQRFVYGQKFSTCVYQDNLCLSYLFGDLKTWKGAIDKCLSIKKRKWLR